MNKIKEKGSQQNAYWLFKEVCVSASAKARYEKELIKEKTKAFHSSLTRFLNLQQLEKRIYESQDLIQR